MRPTAIRYVLDSQRKLLEENTPQSKQVVSPELAYVMTYMLRERSSAAPESRPARSDARRGQDRHHQRLLERVVHRLHPAAGDRVWVGYDRPRSLGKDETGSRVAVPIWTAFMQEALAGTPPEDFPIPERVVWCRWT